MLASQRPVLLIATRYTGIPLVNQYKGISKYPGKMIFDGQASVLARIHVR